MVRPRGVTTKERDATRIEVDGESVSGIVILLPDQLDALHCSVIVDSCQVQDDDLLWLFDTGQTNALTFSPHHSPGRLYAASSVGEVYALNARTGELLWSIELDAELQPPPVAAGSTVYIEHERATTTPWTRPPESICSSTPRRPAGFGASNCVTAPST